MYSVLSNTRCRDVHNILSNTISDHMYKVLSNTRSRDVHNILSNTLYSNMCIVLSLLFALSILAPGGKENADPKLGKSVLNTYLLFLCNFMVINVACIQERVCVRVYSCPHTCMCVPACI